jgi:ssDNA-binding Zn-finger/Zn-ribbon topoisomerase 1
MPVSKNIKSANSEKKEQNDQYCPVCGAPVRPGYNTKYGRVIVCMNYPRCSFFVIVHHKDD